MEVLIIIVVFYGGLYLIGKLFDWRADVNKEKKRAIRDKVLDELQNEFDIKGKINEYKNKLEEINYTGKENYYNKYLKMQNIKLIGKFGNFLNNCPDCHKGRLVARTGKYGKFIGCSNFPNCTYTTNIEDEKSKYNQSVKEQIMSDINKAYS